ncbi:MAG: carboxypeptidase regulatory-like domain-containing protein [Acidobacteria bacterium]|nr:carboxypeptidase regulatory-like domain-containing protein [Acidobacteriota bacterium]
MHRKLTKLFLCLLFASAQLIWAQAVGGTLSGKITAASGAPVPNAAVTITNVTTGASQRALTGPDGNFSIAGLPPGTYKVDVESAGFKRTTQQNIELTTTGPAVVNITLEAGNVTQTVEIKAFAPVVQTENGETGIGFGTRPVRQWPVIDRNHQELVGLYSGVTPPIRAFEPVVDPMRNRLFSVNGQSPLANWWYIEGVINQEPFRGGEVRVIPNEAIQQMNIVTSTHSAPLGFAGGSFTMTNMRGGTNEWHGSLFEFNQNNLFRNRNFFNQAGIDDPKVVYNQFGGTVGKSIITDKLFFFGSYQGQYDRNGNTQITTVPTAALRAGDLSAFPATTIYDPSTGTSTGFGRQPFANNTIPSGFINPFSAALVNSLPLPNLPGLENNFVGNNYIRDDAQNADGRIDYHHSDRTSAFFRYGFSNFGVVQTSVLGPLGSDSGIDRLVSQNSVASITHSFGSGTIADGRRFRTRYRLRQHPLVFGGPLTSTSGVFTPFSDVAPAIQIEGMPGIGVTPAFAPTQGVDNTYEATTNWAMHTDKHNIKFGIDVRNLRAEGFPNLLLAPGGAATFGAGATALASTPGITNTFANSYAAFLLGAPTAAGFSAYGVEPSYRTTQYGAYLMDTFHPMRNLNVELGVRYDVFSPVSPQHSGQAMFYNPADNTVSYSGVGGIDRNIRDYDLNNVAPRIGFAWNVRNKTVIRGGYSINYFQMPLAFDGMMPTVLGTSAGTANAFTPVPAAVGLITGPNGTTFTTLPVPAPTVVGGVNAENLVNGTPAPNVPLSFVAMNHQCRGSRHWHRRPTVERCLRTYSRYLFVRLGADQQLQRAAGQSLQALFPWPQLSGRLYLQQGPGLLQQRGRAAQSVRPQGKLWPRRF